MQHRICHASIGYYRMQHIASSCSSFFSSHYRLLHLSSHPFPLSAAQFPNRRASTSHQRHVRKKPFKKPAGVDQFQAQCNQVNAILSSRSTPGIEIPLTQFPIATKQIIDARQLDLLPAFIRLFSLRLEGIAQEEKYIQQIVNLIDPALMALKLENEEVWRHVTQLILQICSNTRSGSPAQVAMFFLASPSFHHVILNNKIASDLLYRVTMSFEKQSELRLSYAYSLLQHYSFTDYLPCGLLFLQRCMDIENPNIEQLQQLSWIVKKAVPLFKNDSLRSAAYLYTLSIYIRTPSLNSSVYAYAEQEINDVLTELKKMNGATNMYVEEFERLLDRCKQHGRDDVANAIKPYRPTKSSSPFDGMTVG